MASNNFWFHKYPFTDFHELDLSFLLDTLSSIDTKVIELNARVDAVESTVASLADRMDTAEDKIETLEGQMSTAIDSISDHETRISSIEDSDIMDAVMLRNVGAVDADAQKVRINYVKDTYNNGEKTTGSDYADIPHATSESAGVIVPAEKEKLESFSVDANGNATFEGTVSGDDPTANSNFATKQYVDSIAITGSASVSEQTIPWTSSKGNPSLGVTIRRYGKLRSVHVACTVSNLSVDVPTGTGTDSLIAYCDLPASDAPSSLIAMRTDGYISNANVYPFAEIRIATSGRVSVYNLARAFSIGESIPASSVWLTYIVD